MVGAPLLRGHLGERWIDQDRDCQLEPQVQRRRNQQKQQWGVRHPPRLARLSRVGPAGNAGRGRRDTGA